LTTHRWRGILFIARGEVVDTVVCGVGIAILEDATASRLAALLFVLPLARDATVLVVDVVLKMALGLVLHVLGVLGTFFPSVSAGFMHLAITFVGAEELGLVAAIATVIMAAVIATAMA